jgi:rare lipoprotein A
MKIVALVVLMAAASGSLGLSGCATAVKRSGAPAGYEVVPGTAQRGVASWYGESYRGKKTASGARFNPDDLTAAHRTLRFGTWVEVRNLNNNRTVIVEVTDRGPFVKDRIIDLSKQAAKEIGMVGTGTAPVELRLLRKR